jgi:parallel beta-helix repeat protein
LGEERKDEHERRKEEVKKIFGILLALALVLGSSLVAVPAVEANGVTPDRVTVITNAADKLVTVQNTDGGFPWVLPDTVSYTNVLGITAMGILKAWELDDKTSYETALAKAYDYCVDKPPTYTNVGGKWKETTSGVDSFPDITFLVWLSQAAAGDASLLAEINTLQSPNITAGDVASLAKERWDDRVNHLGATPPSEEGTATAMAQRIRDERHGQGWDTLIPWDLETGVKAAKVLDGYYPGEGYDQQAIDIAEVIYDSIDDTGDVYFDSTNTSQEDYIAGLTGGIEAFREVGLHLNKAAELVDLLLAEQQSGGYWDYYGATPVSKSVQATAYAVMALQDYDTEAVTATWKAAIWLMTSQNVDGGWYAEGGTGDEIAEIDSEAAWALARLPAPVTVESSTMIFEGDLTDAGGGVYTGNISMTEGEYYVPGGPGEGIWDEGGFDVYAKEGGCAYSDGYYGTGDWNCDGTDTYIVGYYTGTDHDAYPSLGGPWGDWYNPDCADWDQYSLELTADHWYLRYTPTGESPMSGVMDWYGGGTGYAAETDPGTVDGTDPTQYGSGSAQEWGWDCGWGEERIPLEFPGFAVEVTPGGSYTVTLTPADKINSIQSSTIVFESQTGYTLTNNGDGTYSGVIPCKVGGGYDIYAKEDATAYFDDTPQVIGSDHDAWPTWTPDTPDWYQYSLYFYEEDGVQKWTLRNHAGATEETPWYVGDDIARGVPMSGIMNWGAMYAAETDVGAYLPGTGTAKYSGKAASYGGGAGYWDMDWSWGSEAVPLEYPGFDVTIEDLGGGDYRVTLNPAEGPVLNVNTGVTYGTIQLAVDDAGAGHTLQVAAGTYDEQVVINKSLTLEGVGDPVIKAPDSPAAFTFPENSKQWEPVVFAFGGTEVGGSISGSDTITVDISGFTVDGNNRVPTQCSAGIFLRNAGGTISDNTVQNMSINGKETFGVAAYGDSDVVIMGNDVSGYARGGIVANGDSDGINPPSNPTPHVVIEGNTVTGPGMDEVVTWAPNGIQIGRGATGKIVENTVTGNGWPGTEWTGSGIIVYVSADVEIDGNTVEENETGIAVCGNMWSSEGLTTDGTWIHDNKVDANTYGISIQDRSVDTTIEDNTIKNSSYDGIDICNFYGNPPTGTVIQSNTITDNNAEDDETSGGIWIAEDVDGNEVTVNFNDIVGNNRFGILNTSTNNDVDATYNWWGDDSGPYHPTLNPGGTGDAVSDHVLFEPWLIEVPTVTTQAATELRFLFATVNMDYTVGGYSPVQVRFAYKKSTDSAWSYTGWVSKSVDGTYARLLSMLTPGGQYAFKAQLKYDDVVDGETVIEGGTLQFNTSPIEGCFIATAAYGTPSAEQIDVLREFRDTVLLESTLGSQFVALYYQLSPPVAEFIAGNELLRTMVRELLVDPIVWVVEATGNVWRN